MGKRRQINTFLPEDTSRDLEALRNHFGNIYFTTIIRIAVRRLAELELGQKQAASSGSNPKEAA